MTSITNDITFHLQNAVQHHLYQQFRIIDPDYRKILDLIRVTRPAQPQVDTMQQGIVLCPMSFWPSQQRRHGMPLKEIVSPVLWRCPGGAPNKSTPSSPITSTKDVHSLNSLVHYGRLQAHLSSLPHESIIQRELRQGSLCGQWPGGHHYRLSK